MEETKYIYHLRNIAGTENFNYCVLQDNEVSHVSIYEGECCIRCAVSRLVHLVCACHTLISDLYVIIVAPGLGLN